MVVVDEWAQVAYGRRQPVEVLAVGAAGAARCHYEPGDAFVALLAAVELVRLRRQVKLELQARHLLDSVKQSNTGLINVEANPCRPNAILQPAVDNTFRINIARDTHNGCRLPPPCFTTPILFVFFAFFS